MHIPLNILLQLLLQKEKSSIMKEKKDFLELIEDRPIIPKNKAKKKPKKPVSFLEEDLMSELFPAFQLVPCHIQTRRSDALPLPGQILRVFFRLLENEQ